MTPRHLDKRWLDLAGRERADAVRGALLGHGNLALLGLGLGVLEGREMTTVKALVTNKAYGYPTRGAKRRREPTILACLRQTASAKATAIQERTHANRAGWVGSSATVYLDRDGTIVA